MFNASPASPLHCNLQLLVGKDRQTDRQIDTYILKNNSFSFHTKNIPALFTTRVPKHISAFIIQFSKWHLGLTVSWLGLPSQIFLLKVEQERGNLEDLKAEVRACGRQPMALLLQKKTTQKNSPCLEVIITAACYQEGNIWSQIIGFPPPSHHSLLLYRVGTETKVKSWCVLLPWDWPLTASFTAHFLSFLLFHPLPHHPLYSYIQM